MTRAFVLTAILLVAPPLAGADTTRCQRALIHQPARFVRAALRLRARCERARLANPAAPACTDDPTTTLRTTLARQKAERRMTARCCGGDRICGTADDESLAALGWTAAVCPGFASAGCAAPVADPGDLAQCLTCTATYAVDQVAEVVDGRFAGGAGLTACQTAIVDAGITLLRDETKALAKCWEDRARGRHTNACPAPGNGKAAPALTRAEDTFRAAVCRACGGADKACDGNGDLAPSTIGFLASCPDVPASGGGSCAGAVGTLSELVGCIECIAGVSTECAGRLPVPAFSPYPAECTVAPTTLGAGVLCDSSFECAAGYRCLESAAGTRYCVGSSCATAGDCTADGLCRPYCTLAGCAPSRCQSPGFGCVGADVLCLDDGGLACRMICTQDSDCVDPYGLVCVNPGFGFGVCIGTVPCQ